MQGNAETKFGRKKKKDIEATQHFKGITGPKIITLQQEGRNKTDMKEILLMNQRSTLNHYRDLWGGGNYSKVQVVLKSSEEKVTDINEGICEVVYKGFKAYLS